MSERLRLPDGFAEMPPGPSLAVALASVDVSRLTTEDLYELTATLARMVAHYQALLVTTMFETALTAHEPEGSMRRAADIGEHCADQLAFELRMSSSYAFSQVLLGRALVRQLPMVLADFQAGQLDQARAGVFVDCLGGLDEEKAREIAARYLVKARALTPAQLRERLRYAVDRADPDRQRRQYLRSVCERDVWLQPFTDGTAFLGASNLPPHLAQAAFNHIDRLARAAKAQGDVRTLPQLRADAYLGLLTGEPFQYQPPVDPLSRIADGQAAADGTAVDDPDDLAGRKPAPTPRHRPPRYRRLRKDDNNDAATDSNPASGRRPATTGTSAAGSPDGSAPRPTPAPGTGPTPQPKAGPAPAPMPRPTPDAGPATPAEPPAPPPPPRQQPPPAGPGWAPADWPEECWPQAEPPDLPPDDPDPDGQPPGSRPRPRPGSRPGTPTTGHSGQSEGDRNPAPTIKPMPDYDADAAAAADAALRVGDDDNEFAPAGLGVFQPPDAIHSPPVRPANVCSCGGIRPADRRGVVDLSIKLTTLAELDNDPGLIRGWGPVLADIARQVALAEHAMPSWRWSVTDETGLVLHHGHTQRRPTAAEAAFTIARDQTCATPGCRRPADRCDLDHRHEHDRHGPSHHGNLGPACPGHHGLRTNHRDYKVAVNVRGIHTWTAPNGRTYSVGPDDRLSLTADLDNPTYQQPPLPDPTQNPRQDQLRRQAGRGANQKNNSEQPAKAANWQFTGYSEATRNAFRALIRKYAIRPPR